MIVCDCGSIMCHSDTRYWCYNKKCNYYKTGMRSGFPQYIHQARPKNLPTISDLKEIVNEEEFSKLKDEISKAFAIAESEG